jgi:hypothetical protein
VAGWLGCEASWNLQWVLAGRIKNSSTTGKDGEPTKLQKQYYVREINNSYNLFTEYLFHKLANAKKTK